MEGRFLFIVNSGEHRQAKIMSISWWSTPQLPMNPLSHHHHGHRHQAVDIELCVDEGAECSNKDDAPFGHTACRQEQKLFN